MRPLRHGVAPGRAPSPLRVVPAVLGACSVHPGRYPLGGPSIPRGQHGDPELRLRQLHRENGLIAPGAAHARDRLDSPRADRPNRAVATARRRPPQDSAFQAGKDSVQRAPAPRPRAIPTAPDKTKKSPRRKTRGPRVSPASAALRPRASPTARDKTKTGLEVNLEARSSPASSPVASREPHRAGQNENGPRGKPRGPEFRLALPS